MQRSFKTIAIAFAGAALLQACSSENLEIPQEELYARAFIKEFGVNAQANPFNVATRKAVKVVTATPTDVKISAIVSGREYLFADYSAVSGSTDITFDLPAGIDDVFVRANGRKIPAKVGETVDLRANTGRAGNSITFCNGKISAENTEPKLFFAKDVDDIVAILPEEESNTNVAGITTDFSFEAKAGDTMTFYPLFWNTSSHHSLGIYWLGENDDFNWYEITQKDEWSWDVDCSMIHDYMQDLYQTRSGKLTKCADYDPSKTDNEFIGVSDMQQTYNYGNTKAAFKAVGIKLTFHDNVRFGFFLKVENGQYKCYSTDANSMVGVSTDKKEIPFDNTVTHIFFSQAKRNHYVGRILHSNNGKPIVKEEITEKINGADPTKSELEYYDEAGNKINPDAYLWQYGFNPNAWNVNTWGAAAPSPEKNAKYNFFRGKCNYSRAAYINLPEKDAAGNITRKRSYFCFEDWSNGPIDLNDLIFIMDENTTKAYDGEGNTIGDPDPTPTPDPEPYEWIIAAEDLGNTYDWDFNDMVVGVSYVASNDASVANKIKVRPLAAGGIMPVYLMFDNPASGKTEKVGKELHSWLGASTLSPVNVGANGEEKSGEAVEIEWTGADDFSLAANIDNTSWLTGESGNMGGFWLLVDSENKYASETDFSSVKNDGDVQCVKPNLTAGDSYVPQMICVGTEWCWPQEEQPIHEVYSGFKPWLSDPATVGSKWYGNDMSADYTCDVDNIVSRPSLTPAAGN